MKLCAIICEYNPFHNGHKYLIDEVKRHYGFDGVVCVMSGSFTQRGDITVMDKFTRAAHAVKGGADCVIQLPVSFSVAPAEIFAEGAIKIINSIPDISAIAFGCENADKAMIIKNAYVLAKENWQFKTLLKKALDSGESYVKSCMTALNGCGGNGRFLSGSNNILAIEYAKAIIKAESSLDIIPVERKGESYNSNVLGSNFSSARAIRQNITDEGIKNNVPDYVYADIANITDINASLSAYDKFLQLALLKNTEESMRQIFGCSEGLENKLKTLAVKYTKADEIIMAATSKRYTSSRIRRILCANLLEIYKSDCINYLKNDLYIRPLAVKEEKQDKILSSIALSSYPVIIRKNDTRALHESALQCLEKDDFADKTRGIIYGKKTYNYTIKII